MNVAEGEEYWILDSEIFRCSFCTASGPLGNVQYVS